MTRRLAVNTSAPLQRRKSLQECDEQCLGKIRVTPKMICLTGDARLVPLKARRILGIDDSVQSPRSARGDRRLSRFLRSLSGATPAAA
mmetsp:Transcript_18813/g.36889  ORF Transcript_18813/g.36889 Transcript_18813/m.36889 type:complete len:88 (+) Transcript_18813:907-1170(+)